MSDNTIRNPAPSWELIHGDALQVLRSYAPGAFDAVITDPPYAFRWTHPGGEEQIHDKKVFQHGRERPARLRRRLQGSALLDPLVRRVALRCPSNLQARRACVHVLSNWRQLPAATDALQWAGWTWRGTAVWDKVNSRPSKGRFRQQGRSTIVWRLQRRICPLNRPVALPCRGCSRLCATPSAAPT